MKVLVIGASGIIGQHLAISIPAGVEATFTRRQGDETFYQSLDITADDLISRLDALNPDVIVNLAGENSPDVVEQDTEGTSAVNVVAALRLADWCVANDKFFTQISSQAATDPLNLYGRQKYAVEVVLESSRDLRRCIVRPSFVLGIRPFPAIGRHNPAERILSGMETVSVNDRLFTACFAWDVAQVIWEAVQQQPQGKVWNVGGVDSVSRLDVARYLGFNSIPVSHDELVAKGYCDRPLDTTYATFHGTRTDVADGFARLQSEYSERELDKLPYKAKEVAAFLRIPYPQALSHLTRGFHALHDAVSDDFRASNPQSEADLLAWYRCTETYIHELTFYHCDPGFNYSGMLRGITERLRDSDTHLTLCLGDGTGDLTLACTKSGMDATYHDLQGSRTAQFAKFRRMLRGCRATEQMTSTFTPPPPPPPIGPAYDAIISLDYLEHVPNVEEWVTFVHASLRPGGIFVAQNAFAIGSGPDGSIPMHLSCNDRWERDWDPLLSRLGFVQLTPQWYQKPGTAEWPVIA